MRDGEGTGSGALGLGRLPYGSGGIMRRSWRINVMALTYLLSLLLFAMDFVLKNAESHCAPTEQPAVLKAVTLCVQVQCVDSLGDWEGTSEIFQGEGCLQVWFFGIAKQEGCLVFWFFGIAKTSTPKDSLGRRNEKN